MLCEMIKKNDGTSWDIMLSEHFPITFHYQIGNIFVILLPILR